MKRLLAMLVPVVLLAGCVSTAETIVTAPFHVAHAAYRAVVPSQAELDRRRGKALRKQEEANAKAAKKAEKERRRADKKAARR